ncbi:PspC domain-containing protein [Micromonospora humidisoli]|uniref:PspC domain-containing protein n=1 Tax=Micromonospora humidisoli TaxID=2807622 RepID=A0ABS2JHQ8_9ACTN|nr:PspC domain-containing protein [Micromonospora humidisoli]MBM7085736.1 PspC domain-containing protein [Micromonospora humidisoli]
MTMDEPTAIRLTGHAAAYPATREAYAALRGYLDDARRALRGDPDADEIVRDLEAAVGDRLDPDGDPVTGARMTAILAEIGPVRPAHPVPAEVGGAVRGRFWCRISEGGWFGGVCLGLAAYGGFHVDWVRTVVLLLTLVTGGLLAVAYLVGLFVLPVVPTVADYERRRDAPRPG